MIPTSPPLPLGVLAPSSGDASWPSADLRALPGLPEEVREGFAGYLETCPIFLAWMGYTDDVIGKKFSVAGGSAVVSDGHYYWRLDAAEYVRTYGIGVPDDAVRRAREANWIAPEFTRAEFERLYALLADATESEY